MATRVDELCLSIHKIIAGLSQYNAPSDVPFDNGLYFFYQRGETSPHAPLGRIVRVGNHPRSHNGLKRRLQKHYSGSKNSSVFRRFLGGAILRNKNPDDPCLQPSPGQGHWERQHAPKCLRCSPVEKEVSQLLRREFRLRCAEIKDMLTRNRMEKQLVATLSLCPVCKPSNKWLGNCAYNQNVRMSGLWNSDYTFDQGQIIPELDLTLLT